MPNQTMVYSCSGAEQEYTMVWFGIFLYLLVSSLKIRFCEQSVFAKSPLTLFSALAHIFSGSCRRRQNSRTSSLAHYQIRLFVQISFLPFLVNSASVSQSLFLALHSFPPVNSIHESYSFKPGYICDHTARLTNQPMSV